MRARCGARGPSSTARGLRRAERRGVMSTAPPDRAGAARVDRARVRILVVDDDEDARDALEDLLRDDGFTTSTAPDGEAALAEAGRALPDVVLTDLEMHPMG